MSATSFPRFLKTFGLVPVLAAALSCSAFADTPTIRIAQQFGSASLPLLVMQHEKMIEKRAEKDGRVLNVEWLRFGGGNVMNDALLSGSLDIATTGVTPLLTIWDKTKDSIGVKGLASLGSVPFVLVSTNPNVNSLKDITSADRIAVPAAKVSIQAIFLQMAAAAALGQDNAHKLDVYTVSMKHPDAVAALVGGGSEVNGHVSSSPYYEYELLKAKNARKVASSLDVIGPTTNVAMCATTKYYDDNPKNIRAVLGALDDALEFIAKNPEKTAEIYKEVTGESYPVEFIQKTVLSPDNVYTKQPEGFEKFGAFMHKSGLIKNEVSSWKDVFFPAISETTGTSKK